LAALDLGAGVEQPINCLIIQNCHDVQSVGKWMDWTLEDNMVNGLIFCATLTSCNAPFVQAGAETSNTRAEAIKPGPGCQLHSQEYLFRVGQSPDVCPIVPSVYFRTIEN